MTITLAAVFAPLAFTGGLTGALFREFAMTLAGAVVISGIVALTITPMMSARLLKRGGHSRFQQAVDNTFERVSNRYERLVSGSLRFRPVTLLVVLVLVSLTGYLFMKTSSELAPEEDQGALFALINAPSYATTDYTNAYAEQMRELTRDLPELDANFSVIGMEGGQTNTGFMLWAFKDWAQRDRSQAEIQQDIQARLAPVATGRFIIVQNSLAYNAQQVTITIDRDRAAALNLPVRDIGMTLSLLVGGGAIAQFDRDSNSYDIIMQVPQQYRENPERLGDFFVRSATGQMVPLSAVITISTGVAATAIEQFSQLNSATISALPMPGITTGDGLATIEEIARPLLPDGFFIDYSGQSRLEAEQGNTIMIAFALAVIVIYLVLAAQFESFRDPLIIMMSVPLSIFGAIIPLNLGLGTLNIYTQVGLITLIGLITKHGILLVEFANQQREEHGLDRFEAIVASAKVRLRPILMTTAAMSLGVVPLIVASGAGAAARYSMGLVIFTGVIIGTMFTLFVVPMFYTFIAHRDHVRDDEEETLPTPA
jgi:multidrug efflux pump